MTDLLTRPILRVRPAESPPDRPVVLVAALGTAAVTFGGLLLFTAVSAAGWFAADTGSFGEAVRVGALGWLLSNGSGLTGGGVSVGAAPLGFLLACAYALYRTGRWAGATSRVTSWYDVGLAALAMAGVYGAVGTVTALVSQVEGVHAPLLRAGPALVCLAAVFGGAGLLHGSGRVAPLLARLPEEARAALLGGAAGALLMLAFGAALFTASLVVHFSTAVTLAEGLHSGLVGGLILALIGAALVPNAVLCAGAFVAGPGFALGTGTLVSPGGVRLGLLPDFPVLAALPTSASAEWLPALILLPVLAGGLAGVVATRRYPVFGVDHAALRGVLAGLVGGVGFGLLTVLATGSIGPGRMQHVGPDVLGTTAVCAVAFVLGGAVAAVGGRWLGGALSGRRRRTRSLGQILLRRQSPFLESEPADLEVTQPLHRLGAADAAPAPADTGAGTSADTGAEGADTGADTGAD